MSRNRFQAHALFAAIALAASAPSFAGEALDIELPSMRTPLENTVPLLAPETVLVVMPAPAPLTREQVQAELREAREAGTLATNGEAGDTDQVLAARDAYNAAQAAAITAAYAAEYERQVALAQAEADRQAEIALAEAVAADAAMPMVSMAPNSDPDTNVSLEFIDLGTP